MICKAADWRGLRHHEWFRAVPGPVVAGFEELLLVSRELRARIKTEGVMRPDSSVNPAVESFRKYKHTELNYLTTIAELKRERECAPLDIVGQMARADDPPATDPPQEANHPRKIRPMTGLPSRNPASRRR